ncbi:MAG: ABC transporter ATP-binding protein [Actinobacteria bacterium]|jgi:branched-chain amino acid transport system ATP-binding protein|nr:ABC transporter ATP-binding protein [Actinomycetota bacterium]
MFAELRNISVYYNKSMAVENVTINVPEAGVVSIIGANGAGKSTILKSLLGIVHVREGEIVFDGDDISGLGTADRVKRGIVLVPEGRQLFPYLSVITNLKLGATVRRDKAGVAESMEYVLELFPRLKERLKQDAGTLSGGEQQMLAIGRGLMANPRLLCMDEPSVGLAPIIVEQVGEVIKDINSRGISVLLVEQNAHLALGVCRTGYVLEVGRVVMEGDRETIRCSEIVKRAYLGG